MALCVAFVLHWVCLFVGRVSCVCLFVSLFNLCLAWGLSVCPSEQCYVWHGVYLYKLCLAWGLSVCPSVQVMFGMGFVCCKYSSLIVF